MNTIRLTSPATGLQFELLFDETGNAYIEHAITHQIVPVEWDGRNISLSMDYMDFFELISLTDAASLAGISRQAMHKAAQAGRVRSVTLKPDGKTYVVLDDVKRIWRIKDDARN